MLPWAWFNLIKSGIDFGVAPMPGVNGNLGQPFVGVSVAYINRSSHTNRIQRIPKRSRTVSNFVPSLLNLAEQNAP